MSFEISRKTKLWRKCVFTLDRMSFDGIGFFAIEEKVVGSQNPKYYLYILFNYRYAARVCSITLSIYICAYNILTANTQAVLMFVIFGDFRSFMCLLVIWLRVLYAIAR